MSSSWEATKAAAMKILGKGGEIPDPKGSFSKSSAELQKAFEAFYKSRSDLEEKLLDVENANAAGKNVLRQFGEKIDKSTLGLDPRDKEEAKKIEQARKLLLDFVDGATAVLDDNDSKLDELDKHLVSLSKCKGQAA